MITKLKMAKNKGVQLRAGVVVSALASHQCGLGSVTRLSVICRSSLLALYSAPTGFSPGTLVLPAPQKPTFSLYKNLVLSTELIM